jgi:3-oxoacyl-[acyl-carrier protein] reductase
MESTGDGEIVNVSSIAGVAGIGSSILYCRSKAALNNLTVTLARARLTGRSALPKPHDARGR